MWASPCDTNIAAGGFGGGGVGVSLPPLCWYIYITSRFACMKYLFLLTTHSNFSVLDFILGVKTNYPLAWVSFFCTLATAFPTSYHMKTVCSCWVWKLSNDSCSLNHVPSALYPSNLADLHFSWRIEFFMNDVH